MKKLLPLIASIFAAAAVLVSCATTVPVQVTKPAEVNMAKYKKLLVQDFRYPREYWYDDAERVSRYASSKLVEDLTATGYFEVSNARDIANWSDLSPVELGKRTGASALFVPEILQFARTHNYETREIKNKNEDTGEVTTSYVSYILVTDTVDVSYRVVDTATGSVYVTRTFKEKDTREVKDEDYRTIPSQTDNGQAMLNTIIQKITRQLAPYTVTEARYMISDKTKSDDMKEADALVKKAQYDAAYSKFLGIWEATKNPAAGGNAALLLEILGRLDEAVVLMEKVSAETGDKVVNTRLAELRKMKKDQELLQQQMSAQ